MDRAQSKGDSKELAQAQVTLVKALMMQMMSTGQMDSASLDEATVLAKAALENASAAKDSLTEASALTSIGQLLMFAGETAEPVRCFERALAIYVRSGNSQGAAVCCGGIAGVSIKRGEHSRAGEALRQAIRHSTEAGDFTQVERHKLALRQLGDIQRTLDGDSGEQATSHSSVTPGCVIPLTSLLLGWGLGALPLGVLLWLTATSLYQFYLQGRLLKGLGYATVGAVMFVAFISWLISSPPDRLPALLVLFLTYGAEKGLAIFWMLVVGVGSGLGLSAGMLSKAASETNQ